MNDRLGGVVARRPLHFFWVLDVSGSMAADGKIQALNTALEETVPLLAEDAAKNPEAELLVRVMTFASAPSWLHLDPVPIQQFRWQPVRAVPQGLTELGLAVRELVPVMRELATVRRGFAPAIVLVSDGHPTHMVGPRLEEALEELLAEPWGEASIRAAVGIGRDADMAALQTFIGHRDFTPVRADSPEELVAMIQWVSRLVTRPANNRRAEQEPPKVSGGRVWDQQPTM